MNVVRIRLWAFGISGSLVLASLILLAIPPALKPGIDFTGGASFSITFAVPVQASEIQTALANVGHPEAIIQGASPTSQAQSQGDTSTYFIRVGTLEPTIRDSNGNITTPGGREKIEAALTALDTRPAPTDGSQLPPFYTENDFSTVSGVIAGENVRNAIFATIAASIAILFYVTWAFRKVPSPFRYGTAAVIALIHDTVITIGLFSLLGKVANVEVNAMFITGILTLIGYSVNDTIVVFDRLRENILKFPALSIAEVVNLSVRETMGRSLNTSLTLLLVVAALMMFAASSIQPLLYVLGAGVIVGTYSSIFIASLILVSWETGDFGRIPFIGRRRAA